MVLIRTVCLVCRSDDLLGAGVFCYSLGTFGNCVLGEFPRQKQTDSSLDFAAADCRALVVVCQARGFAGNSFEYVVDEGVHDAHCLAGDSGVGMDLFQYLVNVDAEAFLSLRSALFLAVFRRLLLVHFLATL